MIVVTGQELSPPNNSIPGRLIPHRDRQNPIDLKITQHNPQYTLCPVAGCYG